MNKIYKCRKGYEAIIMSTAAGHYIGTTDEEGIPNCRATDYYTGKNGFATCKAALENGTYTQRTCEENTFVCGVGACKIKPVDDNEFPCCRHDTPRTPDWCENNCERYHSCDTVAEALDKECE